MCNLVSMVVHRISLGQLRTEQTTLVVPSNTEGIPGLSTLSCPGGPCSPEIVLLASWTSWEFPRCSYDGDLQIPGPSCPIGPKDITGIPKYVAN